MREENFTIIDDGSAASVPATVQDDQIRLDHADIKRALGWELKSEGFCREAACVPVPEASSVVTDAGVDLLQFARLIDRPLALDAEERAAYLGTSAGDRGEALATLQAPDFTLPDVEGKLHSLSDYRGQKILLVAYASW
ncbi:MAG: redoxin domain-containing protein [Chloroflexi bacterium]|nr:redoxin domain-containing protein [Chloroflexota bacterium]